ncbi:hypothetical protein GCK72_004263 [Caenorhabditis remanei]|uniref:Uncharacterized protein n=1 Tax=Caenorhabditis remanei TaxID=31234 RepID=E3NEZ7_CAERE|nr:hypothetical protein GCK72_004264 [Caenorhabditis remanei]XP_053588769.1 hypothetical protein GCK72_004263 [Caenorhabditis remanei]EFO95862.1 hypothetical protein CRE_14297 [Caenorhabditis remanei]KAF1764316.1 hypothetical protein GCK72_004263 [Caenorhabditis remanei]KAF1764317.1 hypothetical protein GCK72_004264 [Caenorhabditis remanei]
MSGVHLDYGTPTKPKMNGQREKGPCSEDGKEANHVPMKKKKKIPKKKLVVPEGENPGAKLWLYEKAAESIIPTEDKANVMPERLFKGLDPLIVHMCTPCKKFNSTRETVKIEDGMIQIPLALCTVCRSHLIAQKNMKFFQHDCPSLKKEFNL